MAIFKLCNDYNFYKVDTVSIEQASNFKNDVMETNLQKGLIIVGKSDMIVVDLDKKLRDTFAAQNVLESLKNQVNEEENLLDLLKEI